MAITPEKEEAVDTGLRSALGNIINKFLSIPINIFVASTLGPSGYWCVDHSSFDTAIFNLSKFRYAS